jgi:TfoX/Sxy family transcriptional regulator of competence genes
MNKEDIIKRAEFDGKNGAYAMYKKDYSASKSYYDNMISLWRYYPSFQNEIKAAYDKAYNTEYARYRPHFGIH